VNAAELWLEAGVGVVEGCCMAVMMNRFSPVARVAALDALDALDAGVGKQPSRRAARSRLT
jgi:hypothetical protein